MGSPAGNTTLVPKGRIRDVIGHTIANCDDDAVALRLDLDPSSLTQPGPGGDVLGNTQSQAVAPA